jgi:hypothetical protein
MGLRQLPSRIELTFWQIVINLLSQSKLLQRLIRWFYLELMPHSKLFIQQIDLKRFVRWSATGLGLGIITGLVISIL